MRVQRSPYLLADLQGDAVHAHGQSYAALTGTRMVESILYHAYDGNMYYNRLMYRRISEDGGYTWTNSGSIFAADPTNLVTCERTAPRQFLDPHTGLLLAYYSDWTVKTADQFAVESTDGTARIFYEISRDGGLTWEAPRQVIHRGAEYDATHWLPEVEYRRNGAWAEASPAVYLADGTVVIGFVKSPLEENGTIYNPYGGYWYEVGFLRGQWNANRTELEWEMGEYLRVQVEESCVGCCEPDLILLRDGRLFTTMRCQGWIPKDIPSARRGAVSADGGLTWSTPEVLCYDDGSPVNVPAAFSGFLRSPQNGKVYWFCNILDHPVYGQVPRYPLTIAEFDEDCLCILRDTVQVVQDLPPGAPPCTNEMPSTSEECGRRYTNFGYYVDRDTGELVLTMPEMPKVSWDDFTSDCYVWRIEV